MRFVWIGLIVLFAIVGAVFGALNGEAMLLDFYFVAVNLPKGAALLGALLVGWVAGGLLVWFGVAMRLRGQLGRARRELVRRSAVSEIMPPAPPDA